MKWWTPFLVTGLLCVPLTVLLQHWGWHFAVAGVFAGLVCGAIAWPFATRINRRGKEDT